MLRQVFVLLGIIVPALLLTAITQVGGVVLLVAWIGALFIKKSFKLGIVKGLVVPVLFILLYTLVTLVVVPPIAKHFGREALPWRGNLRPLTIWTCILNRNYVTTPLKEMVLASTNKFLIERPARKVNYLDANFPFINEFPLWPHLSHDDGRKLDIAFFYTNNKGEVVTGAPSFIGYGVCEEPLPGEVNYPERCQGKGYWQYSLLKKAIPQGKKSEYLFDGDATARFVRLLVSDQRTQKLFIEPHLKDRMKLHSSKIRYHGCQAVRHDDHIHVQVK